MQNNNIEELKQKLENDIKLPDNQEGDNPSGYHENKLIK